MNVKEWLEALKLPVARKLWEIGNERIGYRDWNAPGVGEVYLSEAEQALSILEAALEPGEAFGEKFVRLVTPKEVPAE